MLALLLFPVYKGIIRIRTFSNGFNYLWLSCLLYTSGDMLGITVNSKSRELSEPFNLPMVGYYNAFGISASNTQQGYMVDDEGYVTFPSLGRLKAEGLTRNELNTKIATALRNQGLLNDATVTVSLLNAQISVLGEVARPGLSLIHILQHFVSSYQDHTKICFNLKAKDA